MPNKFSSASTRQEVLGELAGAASACWESLTRAGEFDSNLAEFYVNEALIRLQELDASETTDVDVELPRFTKDETMRLEALQMAINTLPLVRNAQQQSFIDRAEFFVNYIKTGETPNAKAN